MRKLRLAILLMLPVFFCGCSGQSKQMQRCLAFRAELLKSQETSFSAQVSADYGTELVLFSMDCTCSEDGVFLQMTRPDSLKGIRAKVTGQEMALVFDDVQAALPPLADDTLPPLAACFLLYDCWREGDILLCEREQELLRMTAETTLADRVLRVDTWLTEATLTPQLAQISEDGNVLLTVEMTDFRL